MKIILDTNFLVYCAKQKIDYNEEIRILVSGKYDLVVFEQIIRELKYLEEKSKKYSDREAAKLALKLLKVNKVKTLKSKEKTADDAIISKTKGNIVATLDLVLLKKLDRVITIRGKKKLTFR
jgi:rRNA-processing protein FCF1